MTTRSYDALGTAGVPLRMAYARGGTWVTSGPALWRERGQPGGLLGLEWQVALQEAFVGFRHRRDPEVGHSVRGAARYGVLERPRAQRPAALDTAAGFSR